MFYKEIGYSTKWLKGVETDIYYESYENILVIVETLKNTAKGKRIFYEFARTLNNFEKLRFVHY